MKTFVLHSPESLSRWAFIKSQCADADISPEFVMAFSADNVREERLARNTDLHEIQSRWLRHPLTGIETLYAPRHLTDADCSLIKKHEYCWQKCVELQQPVLVLEDDAELGYGARGLLSRAEAEWAEPRLPSAGEIVMLGGDWDFQPTHLRRGKVLHYGPLQRTRYTHAYMVNPIGASTLLEGFKKWYQPIDIQMNRVIEDTGLVVAWAWPCIHQNKTFPSTLEHV